MNGRLLSNKNIWFGFLKKLLCEIESPNAPKISKIKTCQPVCLAAYDKIIKNLPSAAIGRHSLSAIGGKMVKSEYEMVLILDGSSREELTHTEENIKKALEKREIEVTHHDEWGSRKLFHAINKLEEGVYHFFRFKGERASIQPLNSDLRVIAGVLKAFITRQA